MRDLTFADLLDPRGRASRHGLIKGAAILIAAQLIVYIAEFLTGITPSLAAAIIFQTFALWLSLVLVSKRLHDLGYGLSHAVGGIFAITMFSLIAGIGAAVTLGEEAMLPGGAGFVAIAATVVAPSLASALWLHFAPGEPGPNRYGSPPASSGFSHPSDETSAASMSPSAVN